MVECHRIFVFTCMRSRSGFSGATWPACSALARSVVVVRQEEQQWTGIRERALAWRMVPAAA